MTVRSTVVRKNVLCRYDWVVEMVTLHLEGGHFVGRSRRERFWRAKTTASDRDFLMPLEGPNELVSDLVDGMLMVVMRCLRAWAPVSRCMPRQ